MHFSEATYHLSYELDGEQPVIGLHTDPANLESLEQLKDDLAEVRTYLGMDGELSFTPEAFGFGGAGRLDDSVLGRGWAAAKFAIPKAKNDSRGYAAPTAKLLPVVTTLSVALRHLNHSEVIVVDEDRPQLVIASLSNSVPLHKLCSAQIRATLTPATSERLATLKDIETAEERVRQALFQSFQYPYGHADEDKFGVSLGGHISFDYPGDASSFSASERLSRHPTTEGVTLTVANNDYPLQQIAILGGLAALNGLVIGRQ